jgi:hypothetical protein
MAEPTDLRAQIERLVERTQDELLEASRQLADAITKETGRFVPPAADDIEKLIDDVFDFAERVVKGQRRLVGDVVRTFNEQTDRAAEAGKKATGRVVKKATAKKTAAKKAPAKKAPAKKAAAKKAPAKKAPAKKAQG